MKFQLVENVAGQDPDQVLRVLEVHLRPLASHVIVAEGRLTTHGIGASPRLRNPRDVAVVEARAENGGTVLTINASYQASALLGSSSQDDVVRSKIEGAIDEMLTELRVARPVRSLTQAPPMSASAPYLMDPFVSMAPPARPYSEQIVSESAKPAPEPAHSEKGSVPIEPIPVLPVTVKPLDAEPLAAESVALAPTVAEPIVIQPVVAESTVVRPLATTQAAPPEPMPAKVTEPLKTFAKRALESRAAITPVDTARAKTEGDAPSSPSAKPTPAAPQSEFGRYAERMSPREEEGSRRTSGVHAASVDLPLRGLLRGQGFVEAEEVEDSGRSWTWIWWVLALLIAAGVAAYVMRDSLPIPEAWRTVLSRGAIPTRAPLDASAPTDGPSVFAAQPELTDKPVGNLYLWVQDLTAALRSSDPSAQASYYADAVDRYQGSTAVSNAAVLKDRKLAIERREKIWSLKVEHIYVESQTASTARVRLVKHVITKSAAGGTAEHVVKTRLKLKKVVGTWKIVEEDESAVAAP